MENAPLEKNAEDTQIQEQNPDTGSHIQSSRKKIRKNVSGKKSPIKTLEDILNLASSMGYFWMKEDQYKRTWEFLQSLKVKRNANNAKVEKVQSQSELFRL